MVSLFEFETPIINHIVQSCFDECDQWVCKGSRVETLLSENVCKFWCLAPSIKVLYEKIVQCTLMRHLSEWVLDEPTGHIFKLVGCGSLSRCYRIYQNSLCGLSTLDPKLLFHYTIKLADYHPVYYLLKSRFRRQTNRAVGEIDFRCILLGKTSEVIQRLKCLGKRLWRTCSSFIGCECNWVSGCYN